MEERYQALLDEIRREFPEFRIVKKRDSAFHRALHVLLKIVTFGGMRSYLDRYQTTIGRTVYVTAGWDSSPAVVRYLTMRHERVHLRQFARYGVVLMALLYVLLPLPLGLAWFRARFEWEAYAETVRAQAELYGRAGVDREDFRAAIVSQFTTGTYGWMWPFRRTVESWYDDVLRTLP